MADSEYNRLARAVRRSHRPAPPVTQAPYPTEADFAAIRLAQSLNRTEAFTRAVLAQLDATPPAVEIDERKLLTDGSER